MTSLLQGTSSVRITGNPDRGLPHSVLQLHNSDGPQPRWPESLGSEEPQHAGNTEVPRECLAHWEAAGQGRAQLSSWAQWPQVGTAASFGHTSRPSLPPAVPVCTNPRQPLCPHECSPPRGQCRQLLFTEQTQDPGPAVAWAWATDISCSRQSASTWLAWWQQALLKTKMNRRESCDGGGGRGKILTLTSETSGGQHLDLGCPFCS